MARRVKASKIGVKIVSNKIISSRFRGWLIGPQVHTYFLQGGRVVLGLAISLFKLL